MDDLDTALTLGELALEMRPRLDVVAAAELFAHVERWPVPGVLPVKRTTSTPSGDVAETGYLARNGMVVQTIVLGAYGCPVGYASFEAMARDGWRPD